MSKKYCYLFTEGNAKMRELLGGKGANLAEMTNIGLPVPQGFTITTEACTQYYEDGRQINDEIFAEIMEYVEKMEKITGKKFGDLHNPLLVSVRSGARASMPGMMDTILNLGLNEDVVNVIAEKSNNPRWAWDCYRRFIQMYSDVVMEVGKKYFEQLIDQMKEKKGVTLDVELTADDLKELAGQFKAEYKAKIGQDFPTDPKEQLVGANIGDDVTVTVTFPTEYHAPELAGKNAEFRCHVHEIRTHDSYQLDDTFAKEIGQCENMEQMRENMGKALQDYYNQRAEQELRWQLMHQAAATVEEQPIDEELDRMVEAQMETLTAQLAQKGLTLEAYCQFTGSDEKKLREDMRPDALEAFRTQKAVEKIAQLENLTVTDEEMDAAIQRICADNHMSAEDLKPYFDNGFLTVVRQQMLRDKATEVVRRSARITQ